MIIEKGIAAMTNPTQSFALKSHIDLLRKIEYEVAQLEKEALRLQAGYICINLAISLWHMADWTWNSLDDADKVLASDNKGIDDAAFRAFKSILRRNPDIAACADIANSSKHITAAPNGMVKLNLGSHDVSSEVTAMHTTSIAGIGDYTRYGPDAWDYLIYIDGERHRAIHVFQRARTFWRTTLVKLAAGQAIGP